MLVFHYIRCIRIIKESLEHLVNSNSLDRPLAVLHVAHKLAFLPSPSYPQLTIH